MQSHAHHHRLRSLLLDWLALVHPVLKQGDRTTPRQGAAMVEVGRLQRTAMGRAPAHKRRVEENLEEGRVRVETGPAVQVEAFPVCQALFNS